ncbi:MAG: hypothetical protein ACRDSZ_03400 [Pseudonocardiaceae bacterium]
MALVGRDRHAAGRAVPLLLHAVDHYGPSYAGFRGLYLPALAGAHALAGDTDTAVTVGHHAVDANSALSSPQAHDRLRTLNTVLESLHASPVSPSSAAAWRIRHCNSVGTSRRWGSARERRWG